MLGKILEKKDFDIEKNNNEITKKKEK